MLFCVVTLVLFYFVTVLYPLEWLLLCVSSVGVASVFSAYNPRALHLSFPSRTVQNFKCMYFPFYIIIFSLLHLCHRLGIQATVTSFTNFLIQAVCDQPLLLGTAQAIKTDTETFSDF